jgi:hypothetical protein
MYLNIGLLTKVLNLDKFEPSPLHLKFLSILL